jgi:hypothetical protein
MGQKVHPTGIRLGIVKDHTSIWYADNKNYGRQLITDLQARAYIEKAPLRRHVSPFTLPGRALLLGRKAKTSTNFAKT